MVFSHTYSTCCRDVSRRTNVSQWPCPPSSASQHDCSKSWTDLLPPKELLPILLINSKDFIHTNHRVFSFSFSPKATQGQMQCSENIQPRIQYFSLKSRMDRGTWEVIDQRVTESQTQLSNWVHTQNTVILSFSGSWSCCYCDTLLLQVASNLLCSKIERNKYFIQSHLYKREIRYTIRFKNKTSFAVSARLLAFYYHKL